jgi:hypothetical protein
MAWASLNPSMLPGMLMSVQGDGLVCAASLEPCFFQKGYRSDTQQKLVFDDEHQRQRHESTENWRIFGKTAVFVQFLGLWHGTIGSFARWRCSILNGPPPLTRMASTIRGQSR